MKSIFENYPIIDGTYEDAVQYVRVLQYVAAIDGVHQDEVKGIKSLINGHNWSSSCYADALKNPIKSINDLSLSDETKKVFAHYLIRDTIAVAHLEGGYSNEESLHIAKIAKELLVSAEILGIIEDAVEKQITATRLWSNLT